MAAIVILNRRRGPGLRRCSPEPGYSTVLPAEADIRTRLTRSISLNLPILSSAMDTVTEARLAIAMAQAGGIGVIHRNLSPDEQAEEVRRVKKFESGMVVNPVTIGPDATLADALALMSQYGISGIPVVAMAARRPAWSASSPTATCASPPIPSQKVAELMTRENLVTVQRGRRPGGGQAPAPPASHREAAGGRRGLSLRRPDHRQGHREEPAQPERHQGRSGPPARRRRLQRRRQGL